MQDKIDAASPPVPVRIVGVNAVGLESGNAGMASGRDLPWLQPLADEDPWALWPIEYRDVAIVGPDNELLGTYNLTLHDLADADNFATLRDQLLTAAQE